MGPPPTWNPIPTFSDAPVGLQLQRREVQQSGHKSKLVPSVAGRLPPFHVPPCHIPCDRNIPKSTSHHSQRLSPCSRPTESSKICKHVQYFPKKAEIYPASPQASCTSTMAFRLLHAPPPPHGLRIRSSAAAGPARRDPRLCPRSRGTRRTPGPGAPLASELGLSRFRRVLHQLETKDMVFCHIVCNII